MLTLLVTGAAIAASGQVVTSTGAPVEGAKIVLAVRASNHACTSELLSTTTDASGSFALAGNGVLRVDSEGYLPLVVEDTSTLPPQLALEEVPSDQAVLLRQIPVCRCASSPPVVVEGSNLTPSIESASSKRVHAALGMALRSIDTQACSQPRSAEPACPQLYNCPIGISLRLEGGRVDVLSVDPFGLTCDQVACYTGVLNALVVPNTKISGEASLRVPR